MKTIQKIIAAFIISAGLLGATQHAAAQESLFTADQLQGFITALQANLQQTLTVENVIAGRISTQEQTTISVINTLQALLTIEETKNSTDSSNVKISVNEEDEDEEEKEDKEDEEEKQEKVRPNFSTQVSSSSSLSLNDTATFSVVVPIQPFDNPVFVPVIGSTAVDANIIDTSTNDPITNPLNLVVTSSARKVTGNDGIEYFRISSNEKLNISSTVQPGAGTYFFELDGVRIETRDVTDSNFNSFRSLRIPFGDLWQSRTITLLN